MGATGTATIDFGSFPGKSDAAVDVTGQSGIVSGSLVEAWIRPVDTADHSADEHMLETLKVFAANIVAGTGFTVYAFNTSEVNEPPERSYRDPFTSTAGVAKSGAGPDRGGIGTRIYGQWSVAWAWF